MEKLGDDIEAYYRLYRSASGGVFWFHNPSKSQTVTIEFSIDEIANLVLQDAP